MKIRFSVLAAAILFTVSGCGGTLSIGGDAGKCIGGQVVPPSLGGSPTLPPVSGEFTFSAPAGSRFALCAW